jgi:glucose-1-phosphatase
MAVRTLLIDLGNVLLFFSHERMCTQIAQECGMPLADLKRILFEEQLQKRFERGELSEDAFRHTLEARLGRPLDANGLRRAASDIFTLNEPMIPLLDRWKRDGYRLVLLSNTSVTHYEWVLDRYDVLERFDHCVLSYRVGAVKPEEAIFRAALAASQCPPEDCFYTDDIEEYVVRARELGIQAEVFRDVPTLRRQLEERGVSCGETRGD